MKKKNYILIAVASYFLFLIATIPAKPITALINNNTQVNIQGVNGTVWDGNAYLISINTNLVLKDTHWSLSLWRLFIGQLAADINSHYLNNTLETQAGISLLGNYFVNDLKAQVAAKDVVQLADIPLVQLSGTFNVDIENAQWSKGELPQASGVIHWSNARVTVADAVSLGNVNILLGESEQDSLLADIDNKGGDISIAGTAQLVPEANYTVDITLSPTASANANIGQSLGMFAKKQNNGSYILKNSGSLQQIGLM
jgi:hypothetical protein